MRRAGFLGAFCAVLMIGCAPQAEMLKVAPLAPSPQIVRPQPQAGSIWPGENAKNSLFADAKARYVNDIVTIIIEEDAEGGNTASTNTARDTSTSTGISALLGLDQSILNRNANMGGKISVGGSSNNSLKGTGDTKRGGKLDARLSARVVDIMDNGNLIIEGKRQLTVNAEDQYLVITGVIRPEDITTENTITSRYIADARIIYTGEGVINDKMRPGWLTRVVDWVWPF